MGRRSRYGLGAALAGRTYPGTVAAATNLLASTKLGDAAWTKIGGSATSDSATGLAGALTASRLTENSSLSQHRVQQAVTLVTGQTYVFSIVFPLLTARSYRLRVLNPGSVADVTFSGMTGMLFDNSAGVSNGSTMPAAGFARVFVSFVATGTSATVYINMVDTGFNIDYTGDGSSAIVVDQPKLQLGSTPS